MSGRIARRIARRWQDALDSDDDLDMLLGQEASSKPKQKVTGKKRDVSNISDPLPGRAMQPKVHQQQVSSFVAGKGVAFTKTVSIFDVDTDPMASSSSSDDVVPLFPKAPSARTHPTNSSSSRLSTSQTVLRESMLQVEPSGDISKAEQFLKEFCPPAALAPAPASRHHSTITDAAASQPATSIGPNVSIPSSNSTPSRTSASSSASSNTSASTTSLAPIPEGGKKPTDPALRKPSATAPKAKAKTAPPPAAPEPRTSSRARRVPGKYTNNFVVSLPAAAGNAVQTSKFAAEMD